MYYKEEALKSYTLFVKGGKLSSFSRGINHIRCDKLALIYSLKLLLETTFVAEIERHEQQKWAYPRNTSNLRLDNVQ
jgi:hypothetical protein